MRTLYIDCGMGAAGDMLTAALLELLPDPDAFVGELNALGIPHVTFVREPSVKCGLRGTHMSVLVHGEEEDGHTHSHGHHHGFGMDRIRRLAASLPVSDRVRADILEVYGLIADAESAVHGVPVTDIHFHEIGSLDAVADVTAVCMLMERLAPDEILASPVCTGSGEVKCSHGILPVPAPATLLLLQGVPIFAGTIRAELCTPTGAALLKHFVSRFCDMPVMTVSAVGCGMGTRDFDRANCLRALLGESTACSAPAGASDTVSVLSCNVDDMTAEEIGFAVEMLFKGGARDVYSIPIGMKKGRPGTLIQVICSVDDADRLAAELIRHTTTIGVRKADMGRYILERETETVRTPFGPVRVKKASGYGVDRQKYEYEDLAEIAREQDISIPEVRALLEEYML